MGQALRMARRPVDANNSYW